MLCLREVYEDISQQTTQIRLSQLITSSRTTTPELNGVIAHTLHKSICKNDVRLLQYKVKSVVAATLYAKISSKIRFIQVVKKYLLVSCPQRIILIQTQQLTTANNCADFGISHVICRECKNEIWV